MLVVAITSSGLETGDGPGCEWEFCCGRRSSVAAMASAIAVENSTMVRTAVDRATMRLHSWDSLRLASSMLGVARRKAASAPFVQIPSRSLRGRFRLWVENRRQKNARELGYGCAGF